MKNLLSILFIIIAFNFLLGQAPNLMSYQAVIWDASGNLVSEKMVSIKISILQGSVTGTSVYSETHRVQTNINGLVSLMIGGGTNATGKISDINWGSGSYFLKTETDPTGGVNFSITGTTQLVSVPYSMFSGVAGNISTKNTGLPGQTLTIDKDGKLIWVGTNIPTVVTGGVSSITQTDSKVSGIVTSDGGSPIISRGFVWSTNPNPTITLSTKTSDGTGVGTYSSSITGLNPNTKYFIRAYASNNSGTGYGNDIEFVTSISNVTMGVPCPGTPTVKDIDDNTYNTVQIGTQCWMRENLKVTKYKNGEKIANVLIDRQNATIGAWSYHLDDSYYNSNFGKLYNWYAATDTRGICPNGWHMPSPDEWQSLRNFLGEQPGTKLKENNPTYWIGHWGDNPTNSSGFSARGAGIFYSNISSEFKGVARFWSNQAYDTQNAIIRVLSTDQPEFPVALIPKGNQISVRCLKD